MLTRSKQLFRRERTIDDAARENEKYSLRVLEECKRKPFTTQRFQRMIEEVMEDLYIIRCLNGES